MSNKDTIDIHTLAPLDKPKRNRSLVNGERAIVISKQEFGNIFTREGLGWLVEMDSPKGRDYPGGKHASCWSTDENDIIFLLCEGMIVCHEDFGYGRIAVSTEEILEKEHCKILISQKWLSIQSYIFQSGVEFFKLVPGGHSCNNRGFNGHCLWIPNIELIENNIEDPFFGKDMLLIGRYGFDPTKKVWIKSIGKKGKVINLDDKERLACIEFDEEVIKGHSFDSKGKDGHCLLIEFDNIKQPLTALSEPLTLKKKDKNITSEF